MSGETIFYLTLSDCKNVSGGCENDCFCFVDDALRFYVVERSLRSCQKVCCESEDVLNKAENNLSRIKFAFEALEVRRECEKGSGKMVFYKTNVDGSFSQ